MATSTKPETVLPAPNPNPDPGTGNSTNNPPSGDLQSQSTPPTNPPTDQVIDPAFVTLMQGTLRESNRQIAELKSQLEAAKAPPPPAPLSDEEARTKFFNNPMEENRRLIREELQATVGPILRDFAAQRAVSKVDQLLQDYKQHPSFGPNITPAVEQYIREQAATINPDNLNEQSFGFIVSSGIGLRASGILRDATPASPPPPSIPTPSRATSETSVNNNPIPPYMSPSAPTGPAINRTPEPQHRALTEDEKRLLREYNANRPQARQMTEAQWIQWQNMPASEVAFTDLGIPKGGK
jgi:hypothetical protein